MKALHCETHCSLLFRKTISNESPKGSIETLMEASMIQSIPAAIHKQVNWHQNKAAEAKIAPARK
jgi:hypothetical protein